MGCDVDCGEGAACLRQPFVTRDASYCIRNAVICHATRARSGKWRVVISKHTFKLSHRFDTPTWTSFDGIHRHHQHHLHPHVMCSCRATRGSSISGITIVTHIVTVPPPESTSRRMTSHALTCALAHLMTYCVASAFVPLDYYLHHLFLFSAFHTEGCEGEVVPYK